MRLDRPMVPEYCILNCLGLYFKGLNNTTYLQYCLPGSWASRTLWDLCRGGWLLRTAVWSRICSKDSKGHLRLEQSPYLSVVGGALHPRFGWLKQSSGPLLWSSELGFLKMRLRIRSWGSGSDNSCALQCFSNSENTWEGSRGKWSLSAIICLLRGLSLPRHCRLQQDLSWSHVCQGWLQDPVGSNLRGLRDSGFWSKLRSGLSHSAMFFHHPENIPNI